MIKSLLPLAAICALSFSALSTGLATPTDYQVTGPVTAITDAVITVTKGKENFEMAKVASVDTSDVKVGDKVTVHYTMTVKSLEKKDAKKEKPATTDKKKAEASPAPSAAPTAAPSVTPTSKS